MKFKDSLKNSGRKVRNYAVGLAVKSGLIEVPSLKQSVVTTEPKLPVVRTRTQPEGGRLDEPNQIFRSPLKITDLPILIEVGIPPTFGLGSTQWPVLLPNSFGRYDVPNEVTVSIDGRTVELIRAPLQPGIATFSANGQIFQIKFIDSNLQNLLHAYANQMRFGGQSPIKRTDHPIENMAAAA